MNRAISIIVISCALLSCNKQKLSINKQVDNTVDKIQSLTMEVEKSENVVMNADKIDGEYFQHFQTLFFEWSGYETKVLANPLNDDVIYTVQKNDKIDIFNVIDCKANGKHYIEVKIPNNKNGFIQISSNPYSNGEYSLIETIKVDENDVKILKMTESFEIGDGVLVKLLPTINSETIYETSPEEVFNLYSALAITSDYNWVKLNINGIIGWVPSEKLSVSRGGPLISTPEATIWFDLIGYKEI